VTTKKLTKLLALCLPYILLGLVATNFGEAWRLSEGKELGDKIMSMMGTISVAFANPLPSLHPLDLLVGLCCGAGLGHADTEMTEHYLHVQESIRQSAIQLFSEAFSA
jgi:type IV secretion system protein VirD4